MSFFQWFIDIVLFHHDGCDKYLDFYGYSIHFELHIMYYCQFVKGIHGLQVYFKH